MKILVTGGHLTPALAFVDFVREKHKENQLVFIGRMYSRKKSGQESREKKEISKRKIEFIEFTSTKLSQNNIIAKIKSVPGLLISTIRAISIISQVKPDVLVSFGGYLAIPVAIAAKIIGVPIATHEQTRSIGIANKLIAKISEVIAVSYKESLNYLPKNKAHLTGNLIRREVLIKQNTTPKWIKKPIKKKILYVTGGSQGSEIINQTMVQVVEELSKNWIVIHQCGGKTKNRNYKKELEKIKKIMPASIASNYYIREWLTEKELAWVYSKAKAIVSRAGANTTEEIANRGIPSILIPLPFSHNDEQLKNALALSEKKQAILLEQKFLNPENLMESIFLLDKYNRKFSRNLKMFSKIENPEEKFYNLVKKISKK